jgi:hypothetical protein
MITSRQAAKFAKKNMKNGGYIPWPIRQKNQDTKRFTKSFHHAIIGHYKFSQTKK